jgi:hypothetical protein
MLGEHRTIIGHLLAGRRSEAMRTLAAHLRRSLEPNMAMLERLRFAEPPQLPPYLQPAAR